MNSFFNYILSFFTKKKNIKEIHYDEEEVHELQQQPKILRINVETFRK